MSQGNSKVLDDIRAKIDRETKLIQGFQSLKRTTTNSEVIQRCNNQIRETQSNIDYLQETLSKLSLQQKQQSEQPPQQQNGHRPVYSRFDLIKYDGPSLGHRIQYMVQQLQFKLQVENQYKAANEKISQLYLMDGDKSSSIAAEGGRVESDQRIQLLNKALKRYQDMHIDVEEVTRDMEMMNTPKYARRPLSGKLYVTITCVRDIDHIASPMFSKRPESLVCVKVDDVERAKTKPSRNGKWNEEFVIDIDKSHELELAVYDKSGSALVPVAVAWALLSDIAEELRKKKVANDGNEGWVTASAASASDYQGPGSGNAFGAGANSGTGSYGDSFGSSNPVPVPSPPVQSTSDSPRVSVSTWINLEPVGQMLVTLSFDKSNSSRKQFMGALGRQGAIRAKKEEVFDQHGHQFVQKQFYNIMCCSLCGEFLRYTGFQCQDCRLLCHRKCYQKVVTKCISKSSADLDSDEAKLNHRIPHRFEPTANRGTKWCCHCGYILPWGRKNVRKCTECGVMCHTQCTHLVPDFCGMSMDMANKILSTIKSTPKPTPKATKPLKSRTGFPPMEPINLGHKALSSVSSDTSGSGSTAVAAPPVSPYQHSLPPTPQHHQFPQHYEKSGGSTEQIGRGVDKFGDPYDEQDRFNHTLPTAIPDQYQVPVSTSEHPYKSQARRPPPPPLQQQQQQEFPGDYTFMSTKSEELLAQPEPSNPFAPEEFDYTHQPEKYASQVPEQLVPAEKKEKSSPHKASRRRRKKVGLDDFQFLAVLGKGNFGKVMLAESRHTNNLCAIKVLKKDFIVENDEAESVKSEKRVFLTANKEMHPFLLNLHCCFQTENRIYFVMEYISGGDLMWHIQNSRFSAKRAKFYACEVLLGLKHFHDNGIVYRDLKLDNILLTSKGHIKIGDYGLCKENMWHKSTTGTFCGTPEFMAPEIVSGKEYTRSVDWWAFGVLLFQMLLCQSPFKGDDEDEIFNAIEHDDVKYPISMPRQTVLILQALLTKDPSMRLGSSERDALEIMEHPYFADVNFDDILSCNIQPPYLPELTSEHDYSNFDKEFTSETPRLTPVDTVLTSEMQEQFRGFSHVSDDAAVV
ncbi:Serine/threonine kinase [Yamadazyma tenuis]|uniref:Protein kinase C-like 1 n=1 Tax=Candida tenuis (strain ATCC 10573 / BCRC 21748 / CBS 615 / JCM 9827 / NBRC 10315 / NRRL Y-1498 / VKM Y-70) TaxID=590646 RepID=G3B394_CANTC|nr:uncharacterized protein CANTEDRAFT_93622 [Yamadazyma tenuis ATCC 10573]EGV64113.1 hypothetical protein CANTEDRAFT_93622 [Yamadazyma tenuis ATCC 10573]WEJ96252.1 Serine/threonine kinase [Yamadazyma tenuis]